MHSLKQLRKEIDAIDRSLLCLLGKRNNIVRRVAAHKKQCQLPVRDTTRERAMLHERVRWGKRAGLQRSLVVGLFSLIVARSRTLQKHMHVP